MHICPVEVGHGKSIGREKRSCGDHSRWRTRPSGTRRSHGRHTKGLPRTSRARRPDGRNSSSRAGPGRSGWANGRHSPGLPLSSRIRWQNGGNTSRQARGSGRARSHAEQVVSTDHPARTANARTGHDVGPLSWWRHTCFRPTFGPSQKPRLRDSSLRISGNGAPLPGIATTGLALRDPRCSHPPTLGRVFFVPMHTGKTRLKIFKWNGEYFGFVRRGYLFSHRGEYRGWIDRNQRVWKSSGEFLGQLVDEKYILRRNTMILPVPKVPKVPPVSPVPPIRPTNRTGRIPKVGWTDALEGSWD